MRALAHVSDLHIGRDEATDEAARQLCAALLDADVDQVLLTGDVTHRGRASELRRFEEIFAPLLSSGRLVTVPGNHDRMGDDAGRALMDGGRVAVARLSGLYTVRVDSTAPHNRNLIQGHGLLTPADLDAVSHALAEAPAGALVAVMLHHHLMPLPEEDLAERLASFFGWPFAAELPLGPALLETLRGRCDLVLHGHRHVTSGAVLGELSDRPLQVLNAGSSTLTRQARIIEHDGGRILREQWLALPDGATPALAPVAA
ncbi:MAG TPA: metallophosphoesterase [Anaeromyxobacteraceae bacterium]|nr:metallophosphoesterase [Anaeromyxobacteraceae bacterium]